jgi:hypothetical protein
MEWEEEEEEEGGGRFLVSFPFHDLAKSTLF